MPPSEVVLDIDSCDYLTHGEQELSGFHVDNVEKMW